MSSINGTNIERMRVNGNEIALAKINGNVVFQKNKLLKTFFGDSKQDTTSGINYIKNSTYYNWVNNSNATHEKNDEYIKIIPPTQSGYTSGIYVDTYTSQKKEWKEDVSPLLNKQVIFSFFAKADLNRTIYCQCGNDKENYFSLTNQWQRFIIKTTLTSATILTFYSGNTLSSTPFYIKDIMLIEGTEDKPYEPYTGGIPSPNPDYPQQIKSITGASLKLTGKNLYDNEYTNNIVSNEGVITPNPNWNMSDYIEVEPNKNYTFSHNDENSTGQSLIIAEFDENKNFIKRNSQGNYNYETYEPYTIITDSNTKFLILNYNNTYNNSLFQLEKGSQVTTYEPYKTQNIPINLQGNILAKVGDYADELQVYSNGDIVLNQKIEKIIFNGRENWIISSLNLEEFSSFYIENILDYNNGEDDVPMICDYFIQKDFVNWEALLSESFIENASNTVGIRLPKKIASTLEEFKNWLQSNNIEVYYVIQNSTTTKVDNIKEELNSFGDYSNIEIETTYE